HLIHRITSFFQSQIIVPTRRGPGRRRQPVWLGPGVNPEGMPQRPRLKPVAQLGGAATAVAIREPYAYLGVGPRLIVLDVRDPRAPAELASTDALPDLVRGVEVAGSTAYVAAGRAGLRIFDIGSPTRPVEVGQFLTDAPVAKVLLQDGLAHLVAGTAGLYIQDAPDARRPNLVARYQPDDALTSMFLSAGRAYLGGRQGLYVLDRSLPPQPSALGFYPLPAPVQAVAV